MNVMRVVLSPSVDVGVDSGHTHTSSTRPHSHLRMSLHWPGGVNVSACSNSAPTAPGKILLILMEPLSSAPCTAISSSQWS